MPQLLDVKGSAAQRPTPTAGPSHVPTRFTRTVPKEFVHRAAVSEVLLTSWRRLDDTHFAVTAQWPRGHSFYRSAHGVHHDPLLLAETVRQCGSLLSHAEFDVPLDHHFLLSELHYTTDIERIALAEVPADLELAVTCHDVQWRRGTLAGMAYEVEVWWDGLLVGTGGARFTCTTPAVYQRLRGDRLGRPARGELPEPVRAALVGRQLPADVVLSAGDGHPGRWRLRADTRHPILFDHSGDHIPGMVLLEAARQAATTVDPNAAAPIAITSTFHRYIEFGPACWLEVSAEPVGATGRNTIRVTGRQEGELAFACEVVAPNHR